MEKLPDGIIDDILSRLPVKFLLRFWCVCKSWYARITDPAFVKLHLSRSLASNSNLSIIFRKPYLYSVDLDACEQQEAVKLDHPIEYSDPYAAIVLGSCNGLLLIYYDVLNIFIWNPSTRRHQKIPISYIHDPRERGVHFVNLGFGYDPTTDDYKVVRIVQFEGDDDDDYSCDSDVEVYSLSTNSWRRMGAVPFHLMSYGRSGFLVNYALHWVAKRKTGAHTASSFIVSFDLKDEEYREVPLPDFVDNKFRMDAAVLGGQLCMICNFLMVRVELWVMKDYGVRDSWVKQFSIELPWVVSFFDYTWPICYTKSGEVIINNNLGRLVLYDPRTGRGRRLSIRGETYICARSLVPLNAKDGIDQAVRKKKSRR